MHDLSSGLSTTSTTSATAGALARDPSVLHGGARGTRTLGLFHAMEALYHLSYSPELRERG